MVLVPMCSPKTDSPHMENVQMAEVKKHLKTHNNGVKSECHICHKILSTNDSMKSHMDLHQKQRIKHKCTICCSIFLYNSDLVYHLKTTHEQRDKNKCTECDKSYMTKLMKIHYNDVHLKIKKFKCQHYDIVIGKSITLFRHKKKVIYYWIILNTFYNLIKITLYIKTII